MSRKKRLPKKKPPSQRKRREPEVVQLLEYEISYDPVVDPAEGRRTPEEQDEVERLHGLARSNPRDAIPDLLRAMERYPDVRQFPNFLASAYSAIREDQKAEAVIREMLDRFPDYLFARLNYAEICLREGRVEEVAEILDHKFDLKLLYPRRDRFHISEFTGFAGTVGTYYARKGEVEIAERYLEILQEMEPDHPMTRRLQGEIDRAAVRRSLKDALGRLPGIGRKWRRGGDETEP